MHPPTAVLLRGFVRGDTGSFDTLYQRIAPQLYVWSSLRVPRALWARLDPEDLVQEVWLRATEALPRFDPELGAFRSWLFGIASRTLAEQLRRLAVRRREGAAPLHEAQELPGDGTSIVRGAVRREQLQRFVTLASALPALDRHLLLRRGLEGQSHREVGQSLGISAEAAEMRWRRLLERLRRNWREAGLGDVE